MNEIILKTLQDRGYKTVSSRFYDLINDWREWYEGDVGSFHSYRVYNGYEVVNMHRYSMGMAKKGCEDWANLLMNEKVGITAEGEAEQTFIDKVLGANNFRVKANELQELKSALGTVAYVLRARGVGFNSATGSLVDVGSNLTIDYVTAENILPLSWENGSIVECAFLTKRKVHEKYYFYLRIYTIDDNGNYKIENVLYENTINDDNSECLVEVRLSDVDEFKNIPPIIHTNSPYKEFVIDKLNLVNNYDPSLPMGVSVFANCIDNLKGVDIAYDAYINEFILGKKRIMVKPEALRDLNGNPVFDPSDTAYYVLAEDSQNGTLIHEINMELRATQFNQGLQDMLNVLSTKMGFGEGHYQFDRGSIQTATQIISENSTLFRTIKKHELILEGVLAELCRAIIRMGNAYLGENLNEDVEISIDFDDSIIEDKGTEFERDSRMLEMGIISKVEFRKKWLNESEEISQSVIDKMEQKIAEEQMALTRQEQQFQLQMEALKQQNKQTVAKK